MATGDRFGHTELGESVGLCRVVIFGPAGMLSSRICARFHVLGDEVTSERDRMYLTPNVSCAIANFSFIILFIIARFKGIIISVPQIVLTLNLCPVPTLSRLLLARNIRRSTRFVHCSYN